MKIKELEWKDLDDEYGSNAETPIGDYEVRYSGHSWCVGFGDYWIFEGIETESEAKQKAKEDFERRIMACFKGKSRLSSSISELIDSFERRTGICVKNIYLNKTDISTHDKKEFLNVVDVEIDFRKK